MIVSVTVESIVEVVEDARTVVAGNKISLVVVVSTDVAFVGDTTTLVFEQGTTVVIVISRSVVKVFLAVRGQFVTEAGH